MPQMQLPIFTTGQNQITNEVGYQKRDGRVYYFLGQLPLYSHAENDTLSFQFFTSQLVVNGHVRQTDIVRAFGVTSISVKRSVKKLKEEGLQGFVKKARKRKPRVLTAEVIDEAQELLYNGYEVVDVAKELNLKADTLRKAIKDGRLKKNSPSE